MMTNNERIFMRRSALSIGAPVGPVRCVAALTLENASTAALVADYPRQRRYVLSAFLAGMKC